MNRKKHDAGKQCYRQRTIGEARWRCFSPGLEKPLHSRRKLTEPLVGQVDIPLAEFGSRVTNFG